MSNWLWQNWLSHEVPRRTGLVNVHVHVHVRVHVRVHMTRCWKEMQACGGQSDYSKSPEWSNRGKHNKLVDKGLNHQFDMIMAGWKPYKDYGNFIEWRKSEFNKVADCVANLTLKNKHPSRTGIRNFLPRIDREMRIF